MGGRAVPHAHHSLLGLKPALAPRHTPPAHAHPPHTQARSYYELSNSAFSFKFPEPGYLEGVKTKDKAILKMQKVGGDCQ